MALHLQLERNEPVTLQSPPAYLQAGTYSALSDRLHLVTAITQRASSSGHVARQGFYADRSPAYSNPSGMNWAVGFCAGVIANTFTADGGDYRFVNPSNVTGSFAASSPTLNRYDILGFQVKDNFYDSSGLNSVIPAVIQGTNSAGTPVDPALPASFIPIVRAVINAAATTPTLQSMIVKTVPSMAILPIVDNTERGALPIMPVGFTIWNIASRRHEVADGAGGWTILPGGADTDVANHAFYFSNAQQVIPANTDTKLAFTASRHICPEVSIGTGNTFTLNKAGVWSCETGLRPPNSSAGNKLLWIGQGGSSTTQRSGFDSVAGGQAFQGMAMAVTKRYALGATVSAWTYSDSGYNLDPVEDTPFISLTWIRP
jgi:hypothetical protein